MACMQRKSPAAAAAATAAAAGRQAAGLQQRREEVRCLLPRLVAGYSGGTGHAASRTCSGCAAFAKDLAPLCTPLGGALAACILLLFLPSAISSSCSCCCWCSC